MREELEQHQRAILAIRKALTGDIHSTSDLLEDIAKLQAQNRHDDEADTLCRNLLCEERDAAENKAASLTLLIREIDGWIKNWGPAFTNEDEWQEVQTHIDSALL